MKDHNQILNKYITILFWILIKILDKFVNNFVYE